MNIPKKYLERIEEQYKDDEGYWVELKKGWCDDGGSHTIHALTQTDLKYFLRNTYPCDCDYCKGLSDHA